jgi:DNA-directed RNA polymerase subunit beta'
MKRRPGRKLMVTTAGKLLFNEIFPEDFPYINNPDFSKPVRDEDFILVKGKELSGIIAGLPLNDAVKKAFLGSIVAQCYRKYGNTRTAEILDEIKKAGFAFATRAGITVAIDDITIPVKKQEILAAAEKEVEQIELQFRRGLITEEERYDRVISVWTKAKDDVTGELMETLDPFNPIFMMAHSGARGNVSQITQLAGMRGLMADPTGRIIDLPIKANFREGLTVLEYFISTHGARKGLADTALKTADSGYLTRRLVDVSQDVIVREIDCGTIQGVTVSEIRDGNEVIEDLLDRINGRFAMADIISPETGSVMISKNQIIDDDTAEDIIKQGIEEVYIRSVLTCKSRHGVCVKCYGRNLATGRIVDVGEAVGIIAAQSIGEPGTQLTMRTFHTGGVAGDDITQGLPRVEELFESRKPKGLAVISEFDGTVQIMETRQRREIKITPEHGETKSYSIPYGARLKIKDGDIVEAGRELTEGSINPHDLLKVKGPRGVQLYLLAEVQRVYRLQGVDINDKHIEVIVRQMLKKVKVEEAGDTDFLPGGLVDGFVFEEVNKAVEDAGGEAAVARPLLLGITKASLATDSFLSAASFQETTRVLTEAAIKGKIDPLLGLKENVIIGKLVPAGTGMSRYRNIRISALNGEPPKPGLEVMPEVEEEILPDDASTEAVLDEVPEVIS